MAALVFPATIRAFTHHRPHHTTPYHKDSAQNISKSGEKVFFFLLFSQLFSFFPFAYRIRHICENTNLDFVPLKEEVKCVHHTNQQGHAREEEDLKGVMEGKRKEKLRNVEERCTMRLKIGISGVEIAPMHTHVSKNEGGGQKFYVCD